MAYGHQELPSSAAGGTFFLLFSLADIRFPQALRPNSCMPKAWQPFLRGSPPQENLPSLPLSALVKRSGRLKIFQPPTSFDMKADMKTDL